MKTTEKIRERRENLDWSQEQMAEKLNLTANGYAKIERGETKLYLDRLEQIAQVFNVDITKLLPDKELVIVCDNDTTIGDNSNNIHLYSSNDSTLVKEIERLKAIIEQKDILLAEKDQRIAEKKQHIQRLDKMIQFLENQNNKSQS
ncbi:helix-turn-helix transcriptional regulator [Moraxella bovis]|uniref:helix-turn-helix domain-containing protein n=1 Tax=Moraxella bovis TaxID=476 RepID=UPI002227A64D|nr:helix-turn-helix transcriptional regulator [Moraxella bovis]UYZ82274.1 helix-turn-helix transcriptional regulator [Moraxella bovis]UZA07295.1 helix-turn-helix transcriptional regulator [Moraxella bovis]UZA10470.1 helix-turn-helix transcriptional regulator [Moraxella bovis]